MAGEVSVSDETVEQVLEFILVLSEKLREIGHLFEENFDISTQEILVLSILAREGSLMVKDIAHRIPGVSASTLTRILDRLEQHGSLVRTLNPVDRRSFRVILTERGRAVVDNYYASLEMLARSMLAPLKPAERLILAELYNNVTESLSARALNGAHAPALAIR